MSPTTRSASNTPKKGKTAPRKSNTDFPTPSDTPSHTPRRVPTCSKCGRPRVGHPRSGCPFVDNEDDSDATEDASSMKDEEVTDALGSMNIASTSSNNGTIHVARSPKKRISNVLPLDSDIPLEDTKAAVRERRRSHRGRTSQIGVFPSLASLPSEDDEVLDQLTMMAPPTQPTHTDSEGEEDSKPAVKLRRAVMPCTFLTPSAASSYASIAAPEQSQSSEAKVEAELTVLSACSSWASIGSIASVASEGGGRKASGTTTPKPLGRTLSLPMEGRNSFDEDHSVSLYAVPSKEVDSFLAKAMREGLHASTLRNGSPSSEEVPVVVGKDGKAVQDLVAKFAADPNATPPARTGGRIRTLAGGALIGAVATFVGLGFS